MAIGVPTKGSQVKQGAGVLNSLDQVELTYPGKRSVTEILSTGPGEFGVLRSAKLSPRPISRLYFGENLDVLAALYNEPSISGKVQLVYIDPPFSTKTIFQSRKLQHAYEDTLGGAAFLEFLRSRLIFLRELLSEDGSIYLHLDEKMVFYAKILMDEIFGIENYRNCITRKKCNPKNYTRNQYGNISDYILFYSKSSTYVWNKPLETWTAERAKEYQYIEPETGRRFMKVPVHAPGIRNGETGKPWRGLLPPPGKHWQFPPSTLDEMDARGEIYWSTNGNPRRKVYLDENPGVGVQDIWLDFKDAHNQNIQITGYPTEKNPELLKRIIESSSLPGDLVLDCFSGSGTTLAVAEQLGRNWIGIDNSPEAIRTTFTRFAKGSERMGDYVETRANPKGLITQVVTPSLFDLLQDETEASAAKLEHSRITDFVFLAENSLMTQAEPLFLEFIQSLQ
jgi:adenine-specific DNA-methyltransferase